MGITIPPLHRFIIYSEGKESHDRQRSYWDKLEKHSIHFYEYHMHNRLLIPLLKSYTFFDIAALCMYVDLHTNFLTFLLHIPMNVAKIS